MLIIGLTGGIGSGKTAAAKKFASLNVSVINADTVAREVVEPGSEALAAIKQKFGPEILLANGHLDRNQLRHVIFADAEAKSWLENLTHPLIGIRIYEQLSQPQQAGEANYRILESPLLLETSQRQLTQRICLIDVTAETQLERTMSRDNNTEQQVLAIMAAQMDGKENRLLADDIIDNNGDLDHLYQQVETMHQQYQCLAKET